MDLRMLSLYTLELSPPEFLLVLKALGGRLKEEEKAAAKSLGDGLSVQKAKLVTQAGQQNEKLIQNLKEAGVWPRDLLESPPSLDMGVQKVPGFVSSVEPHE